MDMLNPNMTDGAEEAKKFAAKLDKFDFPSLMTNDLLCEKLELPIDGLVCYQSFMTLGARLAALQNNKEMLVTTMDAAFKLGVRMGYAYANKAK